MRIIFFIFIFLTTLYTPSGFTAARFPPPDFESNYSQPLLTFQEFYTGLRQYVDVFILFISLVLAAWILHRKRSRSGLFLLGIFCLFYFGFYKEGCICPIGSIQNVTLGLVDSSYLISIPVIFIFMLPLVFALFYGRVFCGSVCPLGIIQDIFIVRSLGVPGWLEKSLGLLRFFYLGLAIYFVLVYNRFIICEHDPFVSMFRFNGPFWRFVLGGAFLIVGMFVARPYCRYICPYGAILSLLSKWTSKGVQITSQDCIECSLCEEVCPFGAIDPPRKSSLTPKNQRVWLLVLSVLILFVLGFAGYLLLEKTSKGLLLGIWFGLVLALQLIALVYFNHRKNYTTNQSSCLSCGRCYKWCPHDSTRREGKNAETP